MLSAYKVSFERLVLMTVKPLAATPFAANGIGPMTLHLELIVALRLVAFLLLICIVCHTDHLHNHLAALRQSNLLQSLHQHYLILLH